MYHEPSGKIWSLRAAAAYFLVMRHKTRNSAMPRIKEPMISMPLLFVGVPPSVVCFASSDTGAGASVRAALESCALTTVADVTAGGALAGGAIA